MKYIDSDIQYFDIDLFMNVLYIYNVPYLFFLKRAIVFFQSALEERSRYIPGRFRQGGDPCLALGYERL